MNYKTIKILLNNSIEDECSDYLLFACEQSNKLYNSTLFMVRQAHFETCPTTNYFDKNDLIRCCFKLTKVKLCYAQLCKQLKVNRHYQAIGGSQAQKTIKSVVEGFKAYNKLLPMWFKGQLKDRPKLPNYRKNGLYQVAFTGQNLKFSLDSKFCYLSIARTQKDELFSDKLTIPCPPEINQENIAELRIIPSLGKLWAE